MKAVVLTYHSHNIFGASYDRNDHVALARDLETIDAAGARIVPLETVASAIREKRIDGEPGECIVGLSFDDGPIFDYEDFTHPQLGAQRGFLNILRDFQRARGDSQPGLHATSFVIASRQARHAMERAEDCGYTYLENWLSDEWWIAAVGSGLMAIGNHSWDHVHHAVAQVAAGGAQRDDFTVVDNVVDADNEIRTASSYINEKSGTVAKSFAFPFGHENDYLVRDYLPRFGPSMGLEAAFGTSGTITPSTCVWSIPRLVCGHDWKTPGELARILAA
jgi:hypothetical protein